MKPMDMPRIMYDLVELKGGYDLLTPTLKLIPGAAREALNFEVSINGGYARIAGYERFDGRPAPSVANYGAITLDAVDNVAVGQTIVSGGNSGLVIAIDDTTISYTKSVGSFSVGNAITQSGNPVGTVTSTVAQVTAQRQAQLKALAADAYRTDIQAVPGSGPVRGVAVFGSDVFAWRNNVGDTAMVIHKATAGGWSAVSLGHTLAFATGTAELVDGDVINGQTSGATATVSRVAVRSGTWGASDAAGILVLTAITGTFQNGENIRVGMAVKAVSGGAQAAITLAPGGRVQTVVGNFGSLNGERLYGCDGVNPAFEFDGTTYVPIATGMPDDTPNNIAVHVQHLFLSFDASLQFSSINEPFRWSPVFGAGEIAMKSVITGLLQVQGGNASPALLVASQNYAEILYGTSSTDFKLTPYSVNMGANRYTMQRLDATYVLDDRGIVNLSASDKFGNFDAATLTYNIRPVTQARRTQARAAGVNREKSQYRVFYADGYALYATVINGKYMGAMPVQFPHTVFCWCEGVRADVAERSFFGSDNGFVYQMDSGSSFDGDAIQYVLLLNYHSMRSPRIKKRYRKASIEVTGSAYAEFGFSYELGYGSTNYEQPNGDMYESNFSPAVWDLFTWDQFTWDGKTLSPTEAEMEGSAENVAIRIYGESDYVEEFTINSMIIHFNLRRGIR